MSKDIRTRMGGAFVAAIVLSVTTSFLASRLALGADESGNTRLPDQAPLRTWTDDTGKHTIEAAFVEVQGGDVRLRTPDGKLKSIPRDRLSAADREHIQQQTAPKQAAGSGAPANSEFAWLSEEGISRERVGKAINDVWGLSPEAAEAKISLLQSSAAAAPEGRATAELLVAVAQERAGKIEAATGAYRQLAADRKGTPYGASASFRLPFLDANLGEEAAYETIARLPSEAGWHLTSGQGWSWGDGRSVALNELLRLRSDGISVRFFEWLRGYSPFADPYAYLFILAAISVGSTVLTLPWQIKLVKSAAQIRLLAYEIEDLKRRYQGDPAGHLREVGELYRRNGISPAAGCLILIVQIAFTSWVLVAMQAYWPRMSLDCSRFLWLSDITQFDVWVVVLAAAAGILVPFLTGHTRAQASASGQPAVVMIFVGAVSFAIVGAIARYWAWPAYVIIFFLLQQILGTITQLIVGTIHRLTG